QRVGTPVAMQVPLLPLGARKRPLCLVTPLVEAHDKDAHRCLLGESVVDSLKPVVKEGQLHPVEVDDVRIRRLAVVDQPEIATVRVVVSPRPHDKSAGAASGCGTFRAHAAEVVDGAAYEQVEPTTHVEGRAANLAVPM